MSISTHYGGSVFAMCGKNSVVIIADRRLGAGNITASTIGRIHALSSDIILGCAGFVPDNQRLLGVLRKNIQLYTLNENRPIGDEVVEMLSYILYKNRFTPYYTQPVLVGRKDGCPYIASMDCIGCIDISHSFMAAGTAKDNLMGLAESLYTEGMDEDQLVVTAAQIFMNGVDRDCLSGSGLDCYVLKTQGIEKMAIKCRMD